MLCHPKYRFSQFTEMRSCEEEGEMKGDYPCFKATYVHEELVEHFLLSPADRAVVETCHRETNRHSVAVLLKTVQYLGYFPEDLQHVPLAVRTFIAAFAPVLSGSPAALLAAATASQPLRPQAPSGRCWPAACLLHPALASRWRGWGRVPGGAGEHGRGAGRRRRGCT